jgi:hypothetical protein
LIARPPTIDPARDKEVARLERVLKELEAIPPHRREDELADVRAETVRAMLGDLGAGTSSRGSAAPTPAARPFRRR